MRDAITTAVEVVGFVLVVVGIFLAFGVAWGLMAAGGACVLLGWLFGRQTTSTGGDGS